MARLNHIKDVECAKTAIGTGTGIAQCDHWTATSANDEEKSRIASTVVRCVKDRTLEKACAVSAMLTGDGVGSCDRSALSARQTVPHRHCALIVIRTSYIMASCASCAPTTSTNTESVVRLACGLIAARTAESRTTVAIHEAACAFDADVTSTSTVSQDQRIYGAKAYTVGAIVVNRQLTLLPLRSAITAIR